MKPNTKKTEGKAMKKPTKTSMTEEDKTYLDLLKKLGLYSPRGDFVEIWSGPNKRIYFQEMKEAIGFLQKSLRLGAKFEQAD